MHIIWGSNITGATSLSNINTLDPKKIKVNSHLIWECEGQHYPAIVKKKHPRWLTVVNMLPANFKNFKLWNYSIAEKQCHYEKVRHLIPPPALQGTSSGRGNETY